MASAWHEPKTIARVALDIALPHLNRLFDYEIPGQLQDQIRPGSRVVVRFSGRQTAGFVVEQRATTEFSGTLQPILKAPSAEPVLRADVYRTAQAIADRYGGVTSDVLRLAVPPRHARTEQQQWPAAEPVSAVTDDDRESWSAYSGGLDALQAWASGSSPRIVMTNRPDVDVARTVAAAARAAASAGRGVIICVPDVRAVERFRRVMNDVIGKDRFAVLTAAQGPAARYRQFLRLSRGTVSIALGTRGAAFAPVHDLGLVIIVDDGDESFHEPRAPYPHAREVLLTRAADSGAGVLVTGVFRTAEAQRLVATGWAQSIAPDQTMRRAVWPQVRIAASRHGERLPAEVFSIIRQGLRTGPVLIQVPRRGYRAAISCQQCRTPARCVACSGPLQQPGRSAALACVWCGVVDPNWRCAQCGSREFRAPVVGAVRLVEEVGQAFSGVPIHRSSGETILDTITTEPSLVIATPGAEPRVESGYAAAVLLDTALALARPQLRVTEEAHRRWFNALALVRGSHDDGIAVAVGESAALQALVRADPVGFAERELADRVAAHLPPAARLAILQGPYSELQPYARADLWPPVAEMLGPVPLDESTARLVIRVPFASGPALAQGIAQINAARSSKKLPVLRTQIDPYDI